jgi:hypothetical protein
VSSSETFSLEKKNHTPLESQQSSLNPETRSRQEGGASRAAETLRTRATRSYTVDCNPAAVELR